MSQIMQFPNKQKLTESAVELFIDQAEDSIRARGVFSAALSGGSTPTPLYRALSETSNQARLDWQHIHLFWGDERPVPADHAESNFRMISEALLQKVPIPEDHVHRVPAEMEVRMAAFSYEETLRHFFTGEWPRFDLVLLGMGEDGHTASLFPNSTGLKEEDRWFIANFAPGQKAWRLTLTKNAINMARKIIVIVSGSSKAEVLADVLAGHEDPFENPIQMISPADGEMLWLVDDAAASQLNVEMDT